MLGFYNNVNYSQHLSFALPFVWHSSFLVALFLSSGNLSLLLALWPFFRAKPFFLAPPFKKRVETFPSSQAHSKVKQWRKKYFYFYLFSWFFLFHFSFLSRWNCILWFFIKKNFHNSNKKNTISTFSHYVIYWTNLTLFDRTFYFNIWKLFYDYFLIIKKRLNIYEDIWIDCSKKNVEWFLYFFIHTMKTTFLFKFWLLKSFLRTRLFGRFAPIFYFNF